MKPIIGLTCSSDTNENKQFKNTEYCKAVHKAGGIPVLIPVFSDFEKDSMALLEKLDGVIITGGNDVHPIFYGEEPLLGLGPVHIYRDEVELHLVKKCIEKQIPLFGICRGLQVINVALGGDLYQDIYMQIKGRELLLHNQIIEGEQGNHSIDIESDTFLYDIFQQKIGWVNSSHHQAIKNIAPSLKPIAWSKDGIIEAAVYKHNPDIFGVQWHPEKSWEKDNFSLKLFKYFMEIVEKEKLLGNRE